MIQCCMPEIETEKKMNTRKTEKRSEKHLSVQKAFVFSCLFRLICKHLQTRRWSYR